MLAHEHVFEANADLTCATSYRRKKGGPDNAINAVLDQADIPVRIVLSQRQSSDKTVAPIVLERLAPGRDLIADRGYDAGATVDLIESRGGPAHIPTCRYRKNQRSVDSVPTANAI